MPLDLADTRTSPRGRRLHREEADARERAASIVADAEERARRVAGDAIADIAEARRAAVETGRAEGLAQVTSLLVALHEREARTESESLDRSIALARLLAERLIGHALSVAPETVVALAQQALSEARGARRLRFRAHPADAPQIVSALSRPEGADGARVVHALAAVEVLEDPALGRGDLRLETDLGVVDARLEPALDRLAARLREVLGP